MYDKIKQSRTEAQAEYQAAASSHRQIEQDVKDANEAWRTAKKLLTTHVVSLFTSQ